MKRARPDMKRWCINSEECTRLCNKKTNTVYYNTPLVYYYNTDDLPDLSTTQILLYIDEHNKNNKYFQLIENMRKLNLNYVYYVLNEKNDEFKKNIVYLCNTHACDDRLISKFMLLVLGSLEKYGKYLHPSDLMKYKNKQEIENFKPLLSLSHEYNVLEYCNQDSVIDKDCYVCPI